MARHSEGFSATQHAVWLFSALGAAGGGVLLVPGLERLERGRRRSGGWG
jgi:hypothetical protein